MCVLYGLWRVCSLEKKVNVDISTICIPTGKYYANKKQVEGMLKYWENKVGNMENIGFGIGNRVFDSRFGNGVIVSIGGTKNYPIGVSFKKARTVWYTTKGFYSTEDENRSLFHGHDLEIIVKEKLPTPRCVQWIFLYVLKGIVETSATYNTETECFKAMKNASRGYPIIKEPFKIEI